MARKSSGKKGWHGIKCDGARAEKKTREVKRRAGEGLHIEEKTEEDPIAVKESLEVMEKFYKQMRTELQASSGWRGSFREVSWFQVEDGELRAWSLQEDVFNKQVRSVLEYAAVVWDAALTQDDILKIERVQKSACSIILGAGYISYEDALITLHLKPLSERRRILAKKFATKASKHPIHSNWFIN